MFAFIFAAPFPELSCGGRQIMLDLRSRHDSYGRGLEEREGIYISACVFCWLCVKALILIVCLELNNCSLLPISLT